MRKEGKTYKFTTTNEKSQGDVGLTTLAVGTESPVVIGGRKGGAGGQYLTHLDKKKTGAEEKQEYYWDIMRNFRASLGFPSKKKGWERQ